MKFAVIALLLPMAVWAQTSDKAFDVMLSGLLRHSVPEVTVATLDTAVLFLDARSRREFDVSHIPGAGWVGYDEFSSARTQGLPRDAQMVVYCSVGYRSEKIAERLRALGFRNVSNLVGGIFDWVNLGNPVVDSAGTTRRVHAYDRIWGVWLKRGEKVYGD